MIKYRLIHQNSNIEIPPGRFDIGRSIECALVLDDPSVSRVHVTLIYQDEELLIEDRGSRNGCLVNGTRVEGTIRLQDGDRVAIGHQTVRVIALERVASSERTLGLMICKNCNGWLANTDAKCPNCGAPGGEKVKNDTRETFKTGESRPAKIDVSVGGVTTSKNMLEGLIKKSISMGRYEEAIKLLTNLMESVVKRHHHPPGVTRREIEAVSALTFYLTEETRVPRHISSLFTFFHALQVLMPRETVESLYGIVRTVGYRSCPEMARYLAFVKDKAPSFNAGDKFTHRRLEGLVGLCS